MPALDVPALDVHSAELPGLPVGTTVAAVTMPDAEGAAADAIRDAGVALARQNSVTAQVDLQVVAAVLGAHAAHAEGEAALQALQRDIEAAVRTRTDLDTPAGAREFQRYLTARLGDIRAVVEKADLDDTSRAALAAALASLYASAGPPGVPGSDQPGGPGVAPGPSQSVPDAGPVAAQASGAGAGALESAPAPAPESEPRFGSGAGLDPGLDPGFDDFGPMEFPAAGPAPEAAAAQAAPPPAAPVGGMPPIPAFPSLGGGPGLSGLGGLGALPALAALGGEPGADAAAEDPPADGDLEPQSDAAETAAADDPQLPVSEVIADAVSGTPIADAFDARGVAIPPPGTPVSAPLGAAEVLPGDVGIFGDRHALALGNGKVLLDEQIQPIEAVNLPGFLGWQHPPEPQPATATDR